MRQSSMNCSNVSSCHGLQFFIPTRICHRVTDLSSTTVPVWGPVSMGPLGPQVLSRCSSVSCPQCHTSFKNVHLSTSVSCRWNSAPPWPPQAAGHGCLTLISQDKLCSSSTSCRAFTGCEYVCHMFFLLYPGCTCTTGCYFPSWRAATTTNGLSLGQVLLRTGWHWPWPTWRQPLASSPRSPPRASLLPSPCCAIQFT